MYSCGQQGAQALCERRRRRAREELEGSGVSSDRLHLSSSEKTEAQQPRDAVLSSVLCLFVNVCMQRERCGEGKKSAASDGHETQFGLRD